MKGVFFVCLVGTIFSTGFAWFFNFGSGRQEAVGPLQDDCKAKASAGDCHFYTCFDERHPCTNHNYALNYGWRYCVRFDQNFNQFTTQGKNWVNNTRKCAMEKMLEFYEDTHVNCEDVQHEMKDNHGRCEAEHGLCDGNLITENKDAFRNIYGVTKKSAFRFLFSIKHCSLSTLREAAGWFDGLGSSFEAIRDQVRGHWDDLRQTLGDSFQDLGDAFDDLDIRGIFDRIRPGGRD